MHHRWVILGAALLPLTGLVFARPARAATADVLTIGSASARPGDTVTLPIFLRDVPGTPVGRDRNAHIQRIKFRVTFSPAGRIAGCGNQTFPDCAVEFRPVGMLADRPTIAQETTKSLGVIAIDYSYDHDKQQIPFDQLAADPGDLIGYLTFVTSSTVQTDGTVMLTLDSSSNATFLSDVGTDATTETVADGTLQVVSGSINLSTSVTDPPADCGRVPESSSLFLTWLGPSSGCSPSSSLSCNTGESITFSPSTSGYSIEDCDKIAWLFGDGTSDTGKSVGHPYSQSGTYTVSMTLSNQTGSVTRTRTISVVTKNPAGCSAPTKANFSVGWSAPSGCSNSTSIPCVANEPVSFAPLVFFYDLSCGSATYLWTFGDNSSSTLQNPTHLYSSAGKYNVTLKFTNPGGTVTVGDSVTISSATQVLCPNCTVTAPASAAAGAAVMFIGPQQSTDCPVATYEWTFGDNHSATTASKVVTHPYAVAGTYMWELRVLSGTGAELCVRDGTITVSPSLPRRRGVHP